MRKEQVVMLVQCGEACIEAISRIDVEQVPRRGDYVELGSFDFSKDDYETISHWRNRLSTDEDLIKITEVWWSGKEKQFVSLWVKLKNTRKFLPLNNER